MKNNRAFWKNPVVVVLSALIVFFTSQILGTLFAASLAAQVSSDNFKMALYVGVNLLVLVVLLTTVMRVIGFDWKRIGFTKIPVKQYVKVIPAFFLYFLISTTLTVVITALFRGFKVDQPQDIGFTSAASSLELIATFISLVVLTPIFEEIIFRGVLFRGLRNKLPFFASAFIASLAFALAHMQWNVAVDTFALSLILCYLVEKTKSVVPAIFLHSLKNSLAFVLLFIIK